MAFFGLFSLFLSRQSRLSRTTSNPTRLIRPRSIDWDKVTEQLVKICTIFAHFLRFERRQNNVFSLLVAQSSHDVYLKRSPQPFLCDRKVIFRATNGGQKHSFLARRACIWASFEVCNTCIRLTLALQGYPVRKLYLFGHILCSIIDEFEPMSRWGCSYMPHKPQWLLLASQF